MINPFRFVMSFFLAPPVVKGSAFFLGKRIEPRYYRQVDRWASLLIQPNLPPAPWTASTLKLAHSKVALITTAGFFVKGQAPFRETSFKGDFDYRLLHRDVPVSRYTLSRGLLDRRLVMLDPNILFPIDRLKELQKEGFIGQVAEHHYSFYNYCLKTQYLMSGSARSCARRLKYEGVDKVVVIPASILSEEIAVLVQRVIESQGTPTVSLLYSNDSARRLKPPRSCVLEKSSSLHRMDEYLDQGLQRDTLKLLLGEFERVEKPGDYAEIE